VSEANKIASEIRPRVYLTTFYRFLSDGCGQPSMGFYQMVAGTF